MAKTRPDGGTTEVPMERRLTPRVSDDRWKTSLTCIEPNKILVRGYPLDEIMGRLTFGEAIYLLLMGDVPSPAIGSVMEAILVSFIDHGATPPSTLAARNTATTGAPLRACVAAGVLGFGRYHGGDIESCMQFLDRGAVRRHRHSPGDRQRVVHHLARAGHHGARAGRTSARETDAADRSQGSHVRRGRPATIAGQAAVKAADHGPSEFRRNWHRSSE